LSFYRQLGHKPGDYPHAERIGAGIVTLPLFPAMRDSDVDRVCEQTARIVRSLSGARPFSTANAAR
jgi:dTDP-4-amino-4,6-dideoxygalactose transaminase